ncbi:MAG: hypothetical protein H7098_11155 [Oligoflexus sp.]|nr:hypothetical protein [Pseudopedobacter sp.]
MAISIINCVLAQEPAKMPEPTQPEVLPAPPMPPIDFSINVDEHKWKEWGEDFAKKFDSKKWDQWGESVGKSFENFGKSFEDLDLSSADLDIKLQRLNIKLKSIKIPAIPEIPALPNVNILGNKNWELGAPSQDATEKVKKLTKSYPVDAKDILAIQNSYGRITVNTWNKNEIKVDVEIRAYAGNDEDAQKMIDGVTISNSKIGDLISFKTGIEQNNKNNNWLTMSFWNAGGDDKQKVEIYYTVYMPENNSINFKTNYSNIVLPSLKGDVIVSMNYGDLTAQELLGITNIKSNYGKITAQKLSSSIISSNYGDIKINQTDEINASLNYCSVDLGNLSDRADLKMNYAGSFKIGSFDKDFKSLNINANYSSINLGFNNNTAFSFDISTLYASFKYDKNNVTVTSKTPADDEKNYSQNKNYKGYYGKNPSGNVVIKSNYGGVKFD